MKKLILSYLIAVVSLFSSCGGDDGAGTKKNDQVTAKSSCLDFVINEKPLTLDPIKIKDVGSFHILSQIYEPLLKFSNKGLELEPLLVDSWSLSDDNLVYTFNLKKGVYFHANPLINEGKKKEFHASDVIYSFERIFSDSEMNYAYSLFKNTIKVLT